MIQKVTRNLFEIATVHFKQLHPKSLKKNDPKCEVLFQTVTWACPAVHTTPLLW